ncbi:hypothetical protein KC352_g23024, partial [Hortaea werneckii]
MAEDRRESMMDLEEVEPSPVDETPSEFKEGYFSSEKDPEKSAQHSKRTSTLGLGGHNTIWYLSRIQKYSSYVFTAFAGAHIA